MSQLFRSKRIFAVLLVFFLLLLFYNSHWMSMLIYPIKYKDHIRTSAAAEQVDPLLIAAIIRVESNYKPDKVSKKGAVGLMQVMPDTANWIAGKSGYDVPLDNRLFEPDLNIKIGSMYVRTLLDTFTSYTDDGASRFDRMAVVAASYNAGPGSVSSWLSNGTWTGSYNDISMIPFGETRHFVERIVYYYKKYERYYADDWNE